MSHMMDETTEAVSAHQVLSKLSATDGAEYYLLTTLRDDGEAGFDLALLHEDKAWTGTINDTEVEMASDRLKMEYEDFVAHTRKALTQQDVGGLQFQYTMKEHRNALTFTWKKHIATDAIKIQLGSVELKKKPTSEVTKVVLEHALCATTNLHAQITALQADKEKLGTERASALKRLEKGVATKEEMERHMYEKFAVVVNDKKAKIRSLQDQLDGVPSSTSSVGQTTGDEGTRKHKRTKTEDSAGETDELSLQDSEYETDGEEALSPLPARARVLSEDDSLILDDAPTTPAAPRRRRKAHDKSKKQTPSRPVIPKCPSKDSTPKAGGSRTGSVKKRRGLETSASNTSEDMDNLLDEM